MTYMESYETFTDPTSLMKEITSDVFLALLFSRVDKYKAIIEAARYVANERFPDSVELKTRLSNLNWDKLL